MKGNDSTSESQRIGSQILAYLAENPDAEDTLEGIIQWWLLQQRIDFETKRVKEALAELITKKLVEEVKGPDKSTFYRLNRSEYQQIRKILEGTTE